MRNTMKTTKYFLPLVGALPFVLAGCAIQPKTAAPARTTPTVATTTSTPAVDPLKDPTFRDNDNDNDNGGGGGGGGGGGPGGGGGGGWG